MNDWQTWTTGIRICVGVGVALFCSYAVALLMTGAIVLVAELVIGPSAGGYWREISALLAIVFAPLFVGMLAESGLLNTPIGPPD